MSEHTEVDPHEYPKYVEVHPSHVDRTNGHISTPLFPQYHVDRNQKVTVLVHDAAEEALAKAAPKEEHKEEA